MFRQVLNVSSQYHIFGTIFTLAYASVLSHACDFLSDPFTSRRISYILTEVLKLAVVVMIKKTFIFVSLAFLILISYQVQFFFFLYLVHQIL